MLTTHFRVRALIKCRGDGFPHESYIKKKLQACLASSATRPRNTASRKEGLGTTRKSAPGAGIQLMTSTR